MKVELGATIGFYSPLGSFNPARAYWERLPRDPSDLSRTEFGGEQRWWVAPRFDIALSERGRQFDMFLRTGLSYAIHWPERCAIDVLGEERISTPERSIRASPFCSSGDRFVDHRTKARIPRP
jgi:hypothetical protein